MDYICNNRVFEKQAIWGTVGRVGLKALQFIPRAWTSGRVSGTLSKFKKVKKGTPGAHRPMLGFGHRTPIGKVPSPLKVPKFSDSPVGWGVSHAKSAIGNTAENLREYFKNPFSGVKKEWERAGTYTRGKNVYKRSIPGRIINRSFLTLPGAATTSYLATRGQPQPKRFSQALKEGITWGPMAPASIAYETAKLPFHVGKMIF